MTWESSNGTYQLYLDGNRTDIGTELHKGGVIPQGGTVVLGQDQDEMGGGFEDSDAFGPGNITELNLWNTVLSESEIVAQYKSCIVTQASVHSWSQFRNDSYLHGEVRTSGHVCTGLCEYINLFKTLV